MSKIFFSYGNDRSRMQLIDMNRDRSIPIYISITTKSSGAFSDRRSLVQLIAKAKIDQSFLTNQLIECPCKTPKIDFLFFVGLNRFYSHLIWTEQARNWSFKTWFLIYQTHFSLLLREQRGRKSYSQVYIP